MLKRLTLFIKEITNLDGHIDTDAAERSIRNNIEFRGPNAWILAVAIIIASVGLNVNSIPVIIGAMLISPLMGPIFGLGLGLGINDINLMKQAGKNLLVMVSISLVVSFIYFLVTPLSLSNPTELLARTRPTIFDVFIALFGGFAGVAIATALMPPLCTAGFSLAAGNFSSFLGAIYLFCINCLFITLATYFLVKYFKFKKAEYADSKFGVRTQRVTTVLIILFLVPSVWSAVILVKQNNFDKHAADFVETHRSIGNSVIYDYKIEHEDGSILKVFMTGETLSASGKSNLYAYAKEYGIKEEQIIIREYTTQNTKEDDTVFKGIYERLGSKIDKHEQTIDDLRRQLEQARKEELPYLQIANEISATYPEVKHVYMGQGAHVTLDSLAVTPCLMVEIKTDSLLSTETVTQFKKWIQVRLQIEKVEVQNIVIE